MLQAGIWSYMAKNEIFGRLLGKKLGVISYRSPSFGSFATIGQPSYWFGMPRTVSFNRLVMDIDQSGFQAVSQNGDHELRVQFSRIRGAQTSINENAVPREVFAEEGQDAGGVSAAQALEIANEQGQRIFTVTSRNVSDVQSEISINSAAWSDIRAAVNAGMEVTVHEQPIERSGWQGSGYVLLDPQTGAGAWKISGGANGGTVLGVIIGAIAGYLTGFADKVLDDLGILASIRDQNKAAAYRRLATRLTAYGTILQIGLVLFDDSLSFGEKAGTLAINLMSMFLMRFLTAGLVALAGTGVVAGVLVAVASIAVSVLTILFLNWLFGLRVPRERSEMYA